MSATRNVGEACVECGQSVAWGSGLYVNRIPADRFDVIAHEYVEGFLCAECQTCDECGEGWDDCTCDEGGES